MGYALAASGATPDTAGGASAPLRTYRIRWAALSAYCLLVLVSCMAWLTFAQIQAVRARVRVRVGPWAEHWALVRACARALRRAV